MRACSHCTDPSSPNRVGEGDYGRMFPDLPKAKIDLDRDLALTALDGPLHARDIDGNREIAAGFAFWGQIFAHDITYDHAPLAREEASEELENHREARLNLEVLYGQGPTAQPYLYDADDPAKLLVGENDEGEPLDLPRNAQGLAILGDPRNDTYLFISQLHLALLRMHNAVVDRLRDEGTDDGDVFGTALRLMRWHYQWMVLREYVPLMVGDDLARDVCEKEPLLWTRGPIFTPLEFTAGVFRVGHAQVRSTYDVNAQVRDVPVFPDLRGQRPLPASHAVDFALLFQMPGRNAPQASGLMGAGYADALMHLPKGITGPVEDDGYKRLPYRDQLRTASLGLPCGEDVARALEQEPLTREELALPDGLCPDGVPISYYVIREAAVRADGRRLGPVGGRVLAEVLTTLIKEDPTSYISVEPDWTPILGRRDGEFGVADMIVLAGMDGAR